MTGPADRGPFERLARRLVPGGRLRQAQPLAGGVSAQVTLVEIERPDGETHRVLVRQHGAADLRRNPHLAADEFRLLTSLQAAGLPAPKPLLLAETASLFPQPCLVVEYLPGAPDFAPADPDAYLAQLARCLAAVHAVDPAQFDLSFLPSQAARLAQALQQPPAALDETLDEARIRAALAAGPRPPANPAALLHGDFWPGNVLWEAGRLVGVIDWEDAALGDPLADVGNARLELLWALGAEAMEAFTRRYLALSAHDPASLPYWDLAAALRPAGRLAAWGLEAHVEQRLRERHRRFVSRALKQLHAAG